MAAIVSYLIQKHPPLTFLNKKNFGNPKISYFLTAYKFAMSKVSCCSDVTLRDVSFDKVQSDALFSNSLFR